MSDPLDAGWRLLAHPRFSWVEGMRARGGDRFVGGEPPTVPPDLEDWATAGLVLEQLAQTGRLTDVVNLPDCWVVAIKSRGPDVRGLAAETFGEAAAWALLAVWGDPLTLPPTTVPEA